MKVDIKSDMGILKDDRGVSWLSDCHVPGFEYG